VDDSLGLPGQRSPGRKRVVWTLLPRRTGALTLDPPALAWFDPREGRYREPPLAPLALGVTPPALAQAGPAERYPEIFLAHPVRPRASGPQAWAWGLAGVLLGAAFQALRRAAAPAPGAVERARAAEWRRALERPARGPDWWRLADELATWLAERGGQVHHVRQQIQAARYGGRRGSEAEVRVELLEHLRSAVPPRPSRWPLRLAAAGLALAAAALAATFGPRAEDERLAARAQLAESWARRGEWEHARAQWDELWQEGAQDGGMAARLAWSWAQRGETGPAALWVMRGWLHAPRDAGLRWVAQRVRESGGLLGENVGSWWPTPLEAALAALLLGGAALVTWPRRLTAILLLGAAAVAAAAVPGRWYLQRRVERAVVMRETQLVPPTGDRLLLEPGQVLRLRGAQGRALVVTAGPGVDGVVDRADVERVLPASR
jgi:hypothetical protein